MHMRPASTPPAWRAQLPSHSSSHSSADHQPPS
eukprot:CAMPEP_0118885032 /NCGR_PEP_ID=MMETSP1163-20130328/23666_1 /TAXON_ID=124430 /ORGANISM="Phaeomonas parva, Strain CCMP2877" /LENGTH=32 /DNA_ID= /DNA_START= /DNA_END= /DNA_ORIENTATION=